MTSVYVFNEKKVKSMKKKSFSYIIFSVCLSKTHCKMKQTTGFHLFQSKPINIMCLKRPHAIVQSLHEKWQDPVGCSSFLDLKQMACVGRSAVQIQPSCSSCIDQNHRPLLPVILKTAGSCWLRCLKQKKKEMKCKKKEKYIWFTLTCWNKGL